MKCLFPPLTALPKHGQVLWSFLFSRACDSVTVLFLSVSVHALCSQIVSMDKTFGNQFQSILEKLEMIDSKQLPSFQDYVKVCVDKRNFENVSILSNKQQMKTCFRKC